MGRRASSRASIAWPCLPHGEDNQTYEALAALACACFSRMRKERFSGVITIWSSRASHPIAQSKVGSFPFTAFFSSLRDRSPLVLSASQIVPAVLPISSSIVIPLLSHNPHHAYTHTIFDQTKPVRPAPVSQI